MDFQLGVELLVLAARTSTKIACQDISCQCIYAPEQIPNIPIIQGQYTQNRPNPLAYLLSMIWPSILILGLLASLTSCVHGTLLTYKLAAHEVACFFSEVTPAQVGSKVAFYFAVRLFSSSPPLSLFISSSSSSSSLLLLPPPLTAPPIPQVQSGGTFSISIAVVGPSDRPIITESSLRQGDYVFTATTAGEYRFCLSNVASSSFAPSEKLVDLEIAIENESRHAALPSKKGTPAEQTSKLEESVYRVSGQLSTMSRMQKYFRTRENRNFSTVRSTEGRILRFSLVEVGMMVGMAGLQVMVVRFFFQGARKGRFLFPFLFCLDEAFPRGNSRREIYILLTLLNLLGYV